MKCPRTTVLSILLLFGVSCGDGHDPASHTEGHEGHEGHEHHEDHEGHDHDEGHEGHHHAAPHGGALIVLGEHFAHAEVLLDSSSGDLTVYLLDREAEKGVRLPQETVDLTLRFDGSAERTVSLEGKASALTGETRGDTSEFSARVESLRGVEAFQGTLGRIEVLGEVFEGVEFDYPEGSEE